eukprot:7299759-Pyramimonas_sp.AAC.1
MGEMSSTFLAICTALCWIIDHTKVAGQSFVSSLVKAAKQRCTAHSMSGLVFAALKTGPWHNAQCRKFVESTAGFE